MTLYCSVGLHGNIWDYYYCSTVDVLWGVTRHSVQ